MPAAPLTDPTVPTGGRSDPAGVADALPPVPAGSAARRLPFDAAALVDVAITLGAALTEAPFRVGGQPVYRLRVPVTGELVPPADAGSGAATGATSPDAGEADEDRPVTTVTVWPSLARVDAANPMASVTMTGIVAIDLIPSVEAIFRGSGGGVTVARNGRVLARTGPPAPASASGTGR